MREITMAQACPTGRAHQHLVVLLYGERGPAVQQLLGVLSAQAGLTLAIQPPDAAAPQTDGATDVSAFLGVPDLRDTSAVDQMLTRYRQSRSTIPLILALGDREEPHRVTQWLQDGAWDFITPPFSAATILPRLWRLPSRPHDAQRLHRLTERLGGMGILGRDPEFVAQVQRLPLVARSSAGVLIQGETGTGKELVARALHRLSPRGHKPFVAVNCAGIPDGLAENELWGHAKGAYTGAAHRQQGLVAEAQGGTLFLDDVDRLSLPVQAKLLRFLQEREYRVLGSPVVHRADVRIVTSCNLDLADETRAGRFRLDLYHRLNVVPIVLPPLRHRTGDIALLAEHFLARYSASLGVPAPEVPPGLMDQLLSYDWPGNVRELEHVIERAVVLQEGPVLNGENLMLPLAPANGTTSPRFQEAKAAVIRHFERTYLERQLSRFAGNVSQAARASGKHRRAFFELLRKHRIPVAHFRRPPDADGTRV